MFRKLASPKTDGILIGDWHSLNERVPYPFVLGWLLIPFALGPRMRRNLEDRLGKYEYTYTAGVSPR